MKETPAFSPKHPCRKDCPERTAECKKTCERWKPYAEAKKEEYKERVSDNEVNDALWSAERLRGKVGCFLGSQAKHTRY